MKFFKSFLLISLIALLLYLAESSQKQSRSSSAKEFGTKSSSCTNHETREVTLPSNVRVNGDAKIGSSMTIDLTPSAVSKKGSIWYNNKLLIENGFITEFKIQFLNRNCWQVKQSCYSSGFFGAVACLAKAIWKFITFQKDPLVDLACGAEGFAFVLQNTGNDIVGAAGYKLGYGGIPNALAVEFDLWPQSEENTAYDYTESTRHISLIIKPGEADANEANSYVFNKKPINFKNEIDEINTYVGESVIRIEYINKNLIVKINGQVQLGYYYPLNINEELKINSPNYFFFGLTASTGSQYYQTHRVTNWRFWMVKPTSASSFAYPIYKRKFKTNDIIQIGIYLFDRCNNYFNIVAPSSSSQTEELETVKKLDWIKPENCEYVNKKLSGQTSEYYDKNIKSQFIFEIKCKTPGVSQFYMIYDSQQIPTQIKVEIEAGEIANARITLPKLQESVDAPFLFILTAYDDADNKIKINDLNLLKKQIYIVWPNPIDSKPALYSIKENIDQTYTYSLDSDKTGIYKITSEKFLNKYHSGSVSFEIKAGEPKASESSSKIVDVNKKIFNTFNLMAGVRFYIQLSLNDVSGNPSYTANINLNNYVKSRILVNGVTIDLKNTEELSKSLLIPAQFTKRGSNSIEVFYDNSPVKCDKCIFSIDPLQPNFENCDLYKYDTRSSQFLINFGDLVIKKAEIFQLLLVMNDEYKNLLDNIDIKNYKVKMSGNNMKEIDLCIDSFNIGARITVCQKDLDIYNNLVGKSNYMLTVTELSSSKTKPFQFTLLTDGSDIDAGNGDFVIEKTSFIYISELKSNNSILAGVTYKIKLQLNTNENLRCTYWIDTSRISYVIEDIQKPDEFLFEKNIIPGTYIMSLTVKQITRNDNSLIGVKKITFKIDGKPIPKDLKFNLLPNEVRQAIISKSDLNMAFRMEGTILTSDVKEKPLQLKTAAADLPVYFSVEFFDDFNNPSPPSLIHLNLLQIIGLNEIDFVSINPEYKLTTISNVYNYTFTSKYCGNYNLRSNLFSSSYTIIINIGEPSNKFSSAILLIADKKNIYAGDTVDIRISPRDSSGRALTEAAAINSLKVFLVTVTEPENDQKIIISGIESMRKINKNGTIDISYIVKKAGSIATLWETKMNGNVLNCEVCAVNVFPAEFDFLKSNVFSVNDGSFKKLLATDSINFENKKSFPILSLNFMDKYDNEIEIIPAFKELKGFFTCIDENKPNITYPLDYSLVAGVLRFDLIKSEQANYQKQLYNDNCSLIFKLKKTDSNTELTLIYPKIILMGDGESDRLYGNDAIDLDKSNIKPDNVTIKADSFVTFLFELKTPSNKYYKFTDSDDYIIYDDSEIEGGIQNVNKQRSAYYGIYIITFKALKANEKIQKLKIGYKTKNGDKFYITNLLKIIIQPSALSYLTIDSSELFPSNNLATREFQNICNSGKIFSLKIKPFDKYNNMINSLTQSDLKAVNIIIIGSDSQIIPSKIIHTSETKGYLNVEFECTKIGKTSLSGLEFRDLDVKPFKIIDKYFINVIAGEIDASNSIASITKSLIEAGQKTSIKVNLFDKYKNSYDLLKLSEEILNKFTVIVRYFDQNTPQILNMVFKFSKIDEGIESIFKLDKSGKHDVLVQYNNIPNQINNNIIMVSPALPFWPKTTFSLFNGDDGTYKLYDNEFTLLVNIKPTFQLKIFDEFSNNYPSFPPEWNLNVYIVSKKDLEEKLKIPFCSVDDSNLFWSICPDHTKKLSEYQNDDYILKIINTKLLNSNPVLLNVKLSGSDVDDGIDLLGTLMIENTVIIPNTDLITVAGKTIGFTIELRTNNKKRVPSWYDEPMKKINLNFLDSNIEQIVFSIEKGDKLGRYLVKLSPTKVMDNEITVVIEGVSFNGYKPKLKVKPSEINKFFVPYPNQYTKLFNIGENILNSTVENPSSFILLAKDIYHNVVPLNEQTSLNIQITDQSNNEYNYERFVIENNFIKIQFQGKLLGNYDINIDKNIYKINLNFGLVFNANSFARVKQTNSIVKSGETVILSVNFFDKWLNPIKIDSEIFNKASAYYQKPSESNWMLIDLNDGEIDSEKMSINFKAILTIKGVYFFKASYLGADLLMKTSSVKVSSNDVDFSKTQIFYFDLSSEYKEMDSSTQLKEENRKIIPKYFVLFRDTNKNVIDMEGLNNPYQTKLSLITDKNISINIIYSVNELESGYLFTLKDNSTLTEYINLFKSKNPYSLKLETSTPKSVLSYPITIQGDGDDSEDCAIVDYGKTMVGVNSLTYIAGNYASFVVQIICDTGFRKRNSSISDITLDLDLKSKNDSNVISEGNSKGSYLISITTGKVYNYPINLTLSINNVKIDKTVKLFVKPNILNYIKVLTDLTKSESADNDYVIEIQGYDIYDNVKSLDDKLVNLQFIFPENSAKFYTSNEDIENQKIIYKLQTRKAGSYALVSSLLDSTKEHKFIIQPGNPYAQSSSMKLSSNSIKAGDKGYIYLTIADKSGNLIKPSFRKSLINEIKCEFKGEKNLIDVQIELDKDNDILFGKIQSEKVDSLYAQCTINNEKITCVDCSLSILNSDFSMKNTKFFKQQTTDTIQNYISLFELPQASDQFALIAQFYDIYNNLLLPKDFLNTDSFQAKLSENNMIPINLRVTLQQNNILIDLNQEDKEYFKNLVVAKDYKITLNLLSSDKNTKNTISIPFNILGDVSDAGNGPYDPSKTFYFLSAGDIFRIIVGEITTLTLELRTAENKRYNGKETNLIDVFDKLEPPKAKEITPISSGVNGRYTFNVLYEVVTTEKDDFILTVFVNKTQLDRKIKVIVEPEAPDIEKTVITKSIAKEIENTNQDSISFIMKDKFGNPYVNKNREFMDKISVKAVKGDVQLSEVTYLGSEKGYVVIFTPHFPPKDLEIFLYYNMGNKKGLVQINKEPIKSSIITHLNVDKTEIVGDKFFSLTTDENCTFFIILKDNMDFCFESSKNISVHFTGSYSTNDLTSTEKSSFQSDPKKYQATEVKNFNSIQRKGYSCNIYYEVSIPASDKVFQKTGFYEMKVFIEGLNNNEFIKKFRDTKVSPGSTAPENSKVSVIQFMGKGNGGVNVKTGTQISILVTLFDSNFNQLLVSNKDNLADINIPSLKQDVDFTTSVNNFRNGSFLIQLIITKIGKIENFTFKINDFEVKWNSLKKEDAPEFFNIIPSDCSFKYPKILKDDLLNSKIISGQTNIFSIQCLDQYGNNVISNDNTVFEITIKGNELENVGNDAIIPKINSPTPGVFIVSFKIAWPGEYTIRVMLNSQSYGESFKIMGQSSMCSKEAIEQNKTLYQCQDNSCVSSYYDCNYPELNSKNCNKTHPYNCKIKGCQIGIHECECPNDYILCEDEKKCVKNSSLCQTKLKTTCPTDYKSICPDNSCRKNELDCPAISVCPPNYAKCADNSCAKSLLDCPDFQSCPPLDHPNRIFKCSDQSCAENPKDCPSRITCPKTKSLLCPDKTCVDSVLNCRLPPICDPGNILCSDQSCRPSLQDCPKQISCTFGKALCQDGSCRDSCQGIIVQESKAVSINFVKLDTGCDMNEYVCPGGECVSSYFLCSTMNSCPKGSVRCPDLSCATSLKECIQSKCQEGQVLCWDGMCVTNITKCSTRSTCPEVYPVKCHDGKCVKDVSQCSPVIPCPSYARYKCSNGDCKANKDDCPTSITCPQELPVQCSDGSCVKASYHCLAAVEKSKCTSEQVRCSDGSCANSKFLCPSPETCATDQIRCWDNSCANDIIECPKVKLEEKLCPSTLPLRCGDGSCRAQIQDCPTLIICPPSRSVKCDDGTCKESKKQCEKNSGCGFGLRKCPDGSCSFGNCGTPITCSSDAPYKCFDNTCRKDPRDCIPPPTCSKDAPILCGDGTCVGQRFECKALDACPVDKPVKCPDNKCYTSGNLCQAIFGCPKGFVECEDGSCMTSFEKCPTVACPAQLRYKCLDGFCVSDLKYCDLTTNGCPFNRPFKCNNGLCTFNETSCPKNNTYNCSQGKLLCPDGSCAMQGVKCNNIMGCPAETPFKCSSGICIDLKKKECPMNLCPSSTPIKCLNGLCAKTISNCASMLNALDFEQCSNESESRVPCADGRCVVSSDLCRPVFACPLKMTRCKDGSCRLYEDLCPITELTCPASKTFRCSSGECAISAEECLNEKGCPISSPVKCDKNGACAKSLNQCKILYDDTKLANKCSLSLPFLCPNGKCVEKSSECVSLSRKCPNADKPNECLDGSCVSNIMECLTKEVGCDKITCPDGTCKSSYSECKAANDCPLDTPYRCLDGSCKSLPLNFQNLNDPNSCSPGSLCPEFKPYKCADGECQGDPKMCRSYLPCPSTLPFRCQDGSCTSTIESCSSMVHCPISTPILCASGLCVEDPLECSRSLNCPEEKPIFCSNGICVTYYWECLMNNVASGKSGRILQNENNTAVSINVNIDSGCNKDKPYRCLDGHCEGSLSNCPVISSCNNPNLPIRCKSGICVSSQDKCQKSDEILIASIVCEADTIRCQDGTCRKTCLPFNGCEGYHCGNGYCATSLGECAGDSTCPLHTPFRCLNNTCVQTLNECTKRKRDTVQDPMILTLSNFNSDTKEFLLDKDTNLKHGTIKIPAGALTNNQSDFALLMLRSVAHSEVINSTIVYDESNFDYVGKTFPLNDGYLTFHQTIRSPIVEITSLSNNNTENNYKFPLVLELDTDIIVNSNKTRDYCLAKINKINNKWNCISRDSLQTTSFSNESLAFPIHQDGSYAIVYNPDLIKIESKEECGFFCKYKNTILYVCIAVFGFILVCAFIIWRVSRYMEKYKGAKKQISSYKEQINELQNNSTDVVGQTVRDKIEGISFTQNPIFLAQSAGIDDPEKIKNLENNLQKLVKREKVLQKAAEELTERNILLQEDNESIKKEISRLKKQSDEDRKSVEFTKDR